MRYLPDWLYGFVPPDWWPNRPREPFWWCLNQIPLIANSTITAEVVFDKRVDALIFGGTIFVVDQATGATVSSPASGVFSQVFLRMKNPAANKQYSDTFTNNGVTSQRDTGFVPADNLVSPWTNPAQRPAYWPIPIKVKKGGSIQLDLQSTASVNLIVRLAFWSVLLYEEAVA